MQHQTDKQTNKQTNARKDKTALLVQAKTRHIETEEEEKNTKKTLPELFSTLKVTFNRYNVKGR